MANTSKHEKKARKAIARAERAIADAQQAAKQLDKKTRSQADKLTQKLEKAVAPKAKKVPKPAKPDKPAKAAKPAKADKPAKQDKPVAADTVAETATPTSRADYRTVAMLRGQARAAGVQGFSTMTRSQLIDALASA